MNFNFSRYLLLLFLPILMCLSPLEAQEAYLDRDGRARELIAGETIKTVQLYREGWPLSYPVYRTGEDIRLVLGFDELGEEVHSFSYRIAHCNADWTLSSIPEMEYTEGYTENPIRDYAYSFSAYYQYIHYSLLLPNDDIVLTLSGNYLLIVYRDENPDDVVFTKRFMITEGAVDIEATAHRPVLSTYMDCCQEVDVKVHTGNYQIQDPFRDTKLVICQNGLWDYSIQDLKPMIVSPGLLDFDYQEGNIFNGGNEFRFFDTKSTRIPSYYVNDILYISPYFHYELKTDEAKPANNYFYREDLNGRYYIESEGGRNPETDADYVFVHFSLQPLLLSGGHIFIAGAFNGWQFNEDNRMDFNSSTGLYEKMLLLKQGMYNYRYVFLPDGSDRFDLSEIEGSHYETENEYLILFYHRRPGERYDRLIGHQVIHSN
ncbi:MAG: DUF5103 domain-containing protein [Bacteroidota bacterium]